MKTLVLLSGGLDSAVVLASHIKSGDLCLALGFDYGQPHRIELERAQQIADHYYTPFEIITLPGMPKVDDVVFSGRNLVFASIAIATAQARGFEHVAVGCNASDWSRFPDCRPPFWRAVETCAQAYGVSVSVPLIYAWKTDVVQTARKLGVPIELTWSCYSPLNVIQAGKYVPCGECLACKTRKEAEECSSLLATS